MKRILVIGHSGQDGRILLEQLTTAGHSVVGVSRKGLVARGGDSSQLPPVVDVTDYEQVRNLIGAALPDEAYYLAAHHHSAEDLDENIPELFRRSQDVHVTGLVNVLDALRDGAPRCRTFYAASSHVFGAPRTPVQDETTPLEPRCAYGITKTAGIHACRFYRECHGLHVSVGILYNHESPYRARSFVSQRIAYGAREALAAKAAGKGYKLVLGNLSAVVDWGYAPDYVRAMMIIVAREAPEDFVVATGVPHTVRDFVATAFSHLGLDWTEYVRESAEVVRKPGVTRVGDPRKLRAATAWEPSVGFQEMVRILVDAVP
jgi:GDPmannose 4,6-dehydratase